jgi:hypothetical protein
VHERKHARLRVLLQRPRHLVGIDRPAPFVLDENRYTPAALDVLLHAAAEHAVDADHDRVAGLDEIHERGLHAGRAGPGDRDRQRVLGAERVLQQALQIVHHRDELRIEMPDRRPAHGGEHARVDIRGTRAHQGPGRREE